MGLTCVLKISKDKETKHLLWTTGPQLHSHIIIILAFMYHSDLEFPLLQLLFFRPGSCDAWDCFIPGAGFCKIPAGPLASLLRNNIPAFQHVSNSSSLVVPKSSPMLCRSWWGCWRLPDTALRKIAYNLMPPIPIWSWSVVCQCHIWTSHLRSLLTWYAPSSGDWSNFPSLHLTPLLLSTTNGIKTFCYFFPQKLDALEKMLNK